MLIYFLCSAGYLTLGVLKMLLFDRNKEGDWLIMLTDERNTNWTWLSIPTLLLCYLTWPIGLVFKSWSISYCVFIIQWNRCVALRSTDYYYKKSMKKFKKDREAHDLKMLVLKSRMEDKDNPLTKAELVDLTRELVYNLRLYDTLNQLYSPEFLPMSLQTEPKTAEELIVKMHDSVAEMDESISRMRDNIFKADLTKTETDEKPEEPK